MTVPASNVHGHIPSASRFIESLLNSLSIGVYLDDLRQKIGAVLWQKAKRSSSEMGRNGVGSNLGRASFICAVT